MTVIGRVLEASYEKGIIIGLNREEDIEDYSMGSLAIVDSERSKYLGLINEVRYESEIDPSVIFDVSNELRNYMFQTIRKKYVESFIKLIPIAKYSKENNILETPDTIPAYGSKLIRASAEDISMFYGEPDWSITFPLGKPKLVGEIDYRVPIDIKNLVNLNFGIYGKSGSGKTFVANLLVGYGILYNLYSGREDFEIRFLIFDMHDEYSLNVLDNNRMPIARGVANIFSEEFEIYTPDIENMRKYKMRYLPIPLYDISSGLLKMIIEPLGVSTAFLENLNSFERVIRRVLRLDKNNSPLSDPAYWVLGLILSDDSIEQVISLIDNRRSEFIETDLSITIRALKSLKDAIETAVYKEGKGAFESFKAGRRRLIRLLDMPVSFKKKYSNIVEEVIDNIVEVNGHSIVISMGRYEKTTAVYLAIANLIGDALRKRVQEKIYEGVEELPMKIIIMLEEAHKFLNKYAGEYGPFGIIAREMRKRGVVVVPIDQKPGDLDPDVTSMIWTSIVFALTDPKDVSAALSGIENPKLYEPLIYSLKPGESLIYGPAVRFPVVLRIEDYSRISKKFEELYNKYRRETPSLYSDDLSRED